MHKLSFRYGTMGASKTANLLMYAHNYEEQGYQVEVFKPSIDTREGDNIIKSRIGLSRKCKMLDKDDSISIDHETDVVMIDEAQFLTRKQVEELYELTLHNNVNIICFGLLTDFRRKMFEGSKALVELSDNIQELKTVCQCGNKATVNARYVNGQLVTEGDQIFIGGNESYISICKECYETQKALKDI